MKPVRHCSYSRWLIVPPDRRGYCHLALKTLPEWVERLWRRNEPIVLLLSVACVQTFWANTTSDNVVWYLRFSRGENIDVGLLVCNAVWTVDSTNVSQKHTASIFRARVPWKWKQCVHPKRLCLSTSPHCVTTQETNIVFCQCCSFLSTNTLPVPYFFYFGLDLSVRICLT
jgi:hypothetical protein